MNYTFNKDNFIELKDFFKYFNKESFDILQLRPIKSMGNTEYKDLNLESIEEAYENIIPHFRKECKKNNITLLAPNTLKKGKDFKNKASIILRYTFCYISPQFFWREDFKWKEESFDQYSKRKGWSKLIFSNIFKSEKSFQLENSQLNYDVEIN